METTKQNKKYLLREELIAKIATTNTGPGVYRMLDESGQIIYVGKAKNLKNRVRTYFHEREQHPRTRRLVALIRDFEVILTDSEAEALILECILIKKHKPRFNVLLKDDKTYPFLVVDRSHTFPKLIYTRKFKRGKHTEVFGPYVSAGSLRQAIQFLNHSFRLRDCSDSEFANRARPCMNYQIGMCSAPCTNLITPENYSADLTNALKILQGKGAQVLATLELRMEKYAEEMEFEMAARLRDQIQALKETLAEQSQKISENSINKIGNMDKDVVGYYRKDNAASFAIVFIRNGKMIDSATYPIPVSEEMEDKDIFFQFLAQFYLTRDAFPGQIDEEKERHFLPGTELKLIPAEILVSFTSEENQKLMEESLAKLGFETKVVVPKRGAKNELIRLANKNAKDALIVEQNRLGDIYKVLSELKTRLHLQNYPRRIECFDISNLGDTGIVASRVVFIEGRADKKLYRHYKLKTIDTQNDFGAMREVLSRRLKKSSRFAGEENEEKPDLLIVDGGKGQLSMAIEVIKELDITGIDVVALAKAKTERDFKNLEVVSSPERVFKPGRMNPIILLSHTGSSHLMQRVRDEAHRFAITFQKKQRKLQKKQ